MFRPGTNQQAMYEWLESFEAGEEREFCVTDTKRPQFAITDGMARWYIIRLAKVLNYKFSTRTGPNKEGFPRLFVYRKL